MDDEPDKREYKSEMEYIMKGDFLRSRDSQRPPRRLVTAYLFYLLPISTRSVESSLSLCLKSSLFVHLSTSVRPSSRVSAPPDHLWTPRDTRSMSGSSLCSRFFVCPMSGARVVGERDIERGREVLKRHKGWPHALKGNDASVTVVMVMVAVVVWVVVADSPLDV